MGDPGVGWGEEDKYNENAFYIFMKLSKNTILIMFQKGCTLPNTGIVLTQNGQGLCFSLFQFSGNLIEDKSLAAL